MDSGKFFQLKMFQGAIIGVAAILMLLVVFKVGMIVGVRQADFSCRWSENYHRNFGGPRGGFLEGFGDRDFLDANGTFGQVIKIDGATLVIQGRDGIEKVIVVKEGTTIRRFQDTVPLSRVQVDDFIVAIGEPNSVGQIEAKLIRILPPPTGRAPIGPPPPMPRR